MKDKEKQIKVFDILDKMEFFQGQRAGRELWNDKPKEVQDKDISDFIKDINYIRSYLQDSVVLSREEYELYDVVKKGYPNDMTCLAEKFTQIYYKARKQTTANIFNIIIQALEERKDRIRAFYGVDESVGIDIAIKTIA